MIFVGYALAIAMGLVLGSIGAGGSLLTVPIMVYGFGLPPTLATGYSLLIVGAVSLVAAWSYQRQGHVRWSAVGLFLPIAAITTFTTRAYWLPTWPAYIYGMAKDEWIMLSFSLLMIGVSLLMFRSCAEPLVKTGNPKLGWKRLMVLVSGSVVVGLISGLVGAGGGFLIVPTLLLLFRLPMVDAVGSSLAIITMNALIGFYGDLINGIPLNGMIVVPFLLLTLLGVWLGIRVSSRLSAQRLKMLFGYFTLVLGVAMFVKEMSSILLF